MWQHYFVHDDLELNWLECYNFFPCVSQDCMSSLFVMLKSFWMEFLEDKIELIFLSITEGTEVIVNSMDDNV